MSKKLTIEFVKESFEKEGYKLLSEKYVNSSTKLNYICPKKHIHSIKWNDWNTGYRCPSCAGVAKQTFEFIKKSFEKEDYILLSRKYINSKTKLNYICPNGHEHNINWNHWTQGHRCPACAGFAKPSIECIKKSFEAEGYTLLDNNYINNYTKLKYLCSLGHEHSIKWNGWQQGKRCPTCYKNNNIEQKTPNWKGGVRKRNVPLYDTYSPQIDFCEETRRDPNETILLQVKCTKCNKFYTPTTVSVQSRIIALNNNNKGEHRFYCSDECKHSCSIYRRIKYSAEEKRFKTNLNFISEELKIWSKEILKRANYICEYCGAVATDAHHIQPKKLEPFFALDPDNGIACCEECHYKYGHKDECSTGALANIICG